MSKKPRKSAVPENETKADKFRRLATKRVGKALKAIGLISTLSSRAGYEYTAAQVDTIASALREKVDTVMSNFNPEAKSDTGAEFSL